LAGALAGAGASAEARALGRSVGPVVINWRALLERRGELKTALDTAFPR
jgi:hypothetical protein